MSLPAPKVQVFWVPKLGNSEDEYEDAAAHAVPAGRYAIADGATESSFSDRWARSLVREYTVAPPLLPPNRTPFPEWLAPLQREWHQSIHWDTLPWFAEEKARVGAFAALLGIQFEEPALPPRPSFWDLFRRRKPAQAGPRWQAMAIGDSCLFQVRADQVVKSFPMGDSASFSPRPLLLGSNPSRNQGIWNAIQQTEGDYRTGDAFFLATDALSKWFVEEVEARRQPWKTLLALRTQAEFAAWVDQLRGNKRLKNDDTTLLQFVLPAPGVSP
jgi:hypothetical protein